VTTGGPWPDAPGLPWLSGDVLMMAAEDEWQAKELRASVKDRAEHVMIVDLQRNELGRVCEPGSGRVDRLAMTRMHRHCQRPSAFTLIEC